MPRQKDCLSIRRNKKLLFPVPDFEAVLLHWSLFHFFRNNPVRFMTVQENPQKPVVIPVYSAHAAVPYRQQRKKYKFIWSQSGKAAREYNVCTKKASKNPQAQYRHRSLVSFRISRIIHRKNPRITAAHTQRLTGKYSPAKAFRMPGRSGISR